MIVGVTGTSQPFDRLIQALAEYARSHPDTEVWVQHGRAVLPNPLHGSPFVPRDELLSRFAAAEVVVTHGGCGALLDALSFGHVPVVMPRLQRFGEHVNDHQLELCDALASEGRAIVVGDGVSVSSEIENAKLRRHGRQTPESMSNLGEILRRCLESRAQHTAKRSHRVWAMLRLMTSSSLVREYSTAPPSPASKS